MAANSKIGFVFTQRGITPEACSSWFLPRVVGIQKALEWVISGDIFMAEEGEKAGLFHSVHDKGEVLDVARCIARKLIALSLIHIPSPRDRQNSRMPDSAWKKKE